MSIQSIDLNADLGERLDDYIDLLPLVSSANVACGAHAGGGHLLIDTISAAIENEVRVGAHPSYPDRENFGRSSLRGKFSEIELVKMISDQVELVKSELVSRGHQLSHLKAHGALYNDAMIHEDIANALVQVATLFEVPILGLPGSTLEKIAGRNGVTFISEGFVDRAYTNEGKLVPRSVPGSVLKHDNALSQVEQLLTNSQVTSIDGVTIPLIVQTLCVHADTPDAAQTAKDVRALLLAHGIELKGFQSNG
jgi:UPF0271 protein